MKKKKLKKRWGISLTLIALFLAVTGSVAIYTSQVYQRAVVRNRYNDVIRFSSDKLYRDIDTTSPKIYYYPLGENQTTMNFTVCNYDQVKSTLYNDKDIQYNITFAINNGTAGDYTITCGNTIKTVSNGDTTTIENKTLQGGHKSVDTYAVKFHPDDYGKVEITVIVTPADTTITQNNKLCGVLIPIRYATTQGVRLEWSYPDSGRGTPKEFDAYNLLVTLSGGQGNVLITWNYEQLDIDPFFASGKTVTTDDTNKTKTITVPMNSEDTTGTYLITFFNHNTSKPLWNSWKDDVPITVALEGSSGG